MFVYLALLFRLQINCRQNCVRLEPSIILSDVINSQRSACTKNLVIDWSFLFVGWSIALSGSSFSYPSDLTVTLIERRYIVMILRKGM